MMNFLKSDQGGWNDSVSGKSLPLIVKGNPIAKPGTIIGIGMAIGGVILASISGWHSGTKDFHDEQDRIFSEFEKARIDK